MRKLIPTLLVLCLASVGLWSQEVGSIDFRTAAREPAWDHPLPQPPADCGTKSNFHHSSGFAVGLEPLKIEFVSVKPATLAQGMKFTATIRLRNLGTGPAQIPWNLSPKDTKSKQDPKHMAYVWGQASVRVDQNGAGREFASTPPLFADSKNSQYWKTLAPGRSVSITFAVDTECTGKQPCPKLEVGEATLTAEWMQAEVSTEANGCDVQTAGMIQYELKSDPLNVRIAREAVNP